MKKKPKKIKEPQKVEIHIYIHQQPNFSTNIPYYPNGTAAPTNPITNPPYYVTC